MYPWPDFNVKAWVSDYQGWGEYQIYEYKYL